MVTGLSLWVCLVGLYVLESLRLVSPQSVIFRPRWFGKGSRVTRPITYPGNGTWAWTLLPLAPLLEDVTLISQLPLIAWAKECFAPNGVLLPTEMKPLAYDGVRECQVEEKTLRVAGAKLVLCESPAEARRIQKLFEEFKCVGAAGAKREEAIANYVRSLFDEASAEKRLKEVRERTKLLRGLSFVLWCFLILSFPVTLVFARMPEEYVIVAFAALTLLLGIAIAVSFAKAGEALDREAKQKYRWLSLKFVVYPVAALRASDDVMLDALSGVHPVAVSCLLLRERARLSAAKEFVRQVKSRVAASVQCDPETLATSRSFNALLAQEMALYLKRKLPEALVEEAIRPQSASSRSYCPNCRAQYVTEQGECADCRGVALERF